MRATHPSLDAIFTDHGVTTAQIAESLGLTNEAVRLWRHGIRLIPPAQARLIDERFHIPKHRLRPDVWDPPPPPPDERRKSQTAA